MLVQSISIELITEELDRLNLYVQRSLRHKVMMRASLSSMIGY